MFTKYNYLLCLLIILLSVQIPLFAQLKTPSAVVHNFNESKHKGYLTNLEDSTIMLQNINTQFESILIEDIHRIDIIVKKDLSGPGLILGAAIGALPGILIFSIRDKEAQGLDAILGGLARLIFGPVIMVAGGIIGGVVGFAAGKGAVVQIPINGNQKLYNKQKEKLKKYSYTP